MSDESLMPASLRTGETKAECGEDDDEPPAKKSAQKDDPEDDLKDDENEPEEEKKSAKKDEPKAKSLIGRNVVFEDGKERSEGQILEEKGNKLVVKKKNGKKVTVSLEDVVKFAKGK
jgi:hypothetical protein